MGWLTSHKPRRGLCSCLFLLLCCWLHPLWAQPSPGSHLAFRHILPDQMAAVGYITAIGQDAEGFMWFGGASGLARYDGYQLHVFRQDDGQIGGLSNSYVNDLLLTRDGSLWVATRDGLNRYDAGLNRFEHYRQAPDNPHGAAADDINSLLEDSFGNLWLGTRAGLFYFNRATNSFNHHALGGAQDTGESFVWRVVADEDGYLWVAHQSRGVSRYHPMRRQLRHYPHIPGSDAGPSFADVRELYVDTNNTLWLGTYGGGLNRFDRAQQRFEPVIHDTTEKGAVVWAVREDSAGNLWVGDGSAVYVREPGRKEFSRFTHKDTEPSSLGNYVVNRLFEDRDGNIWIGFFPAGVDRVDRQASVFRNYHYSSANPNTVADGGVLSALEDPKGNLWIGSGYGLSYFDRQGNRFTRYHHDPANPQSLSGNTVLSLALSKPAVDGSSVEGPSQLWLGIWSGGVNRLDIASGRVTRYSPSDAPGGLRGREPWSVIVDRQGEVWVATEQGLNHYRPGTDSFEFFAPSPADLDGDTALYTRVVYEDKRGNLWLGGRRGLFLFDRATGQFTRYAHDPANPKSLATNFVFTVYEDSQGRLWVGTDGGGLNLMDRDTGEFTAYSLEQGLSDSAVAGIVEDDLGNLWLGTQNGITRFNPQDGSTRNYDKRHGLGDILYNRNTPLKTHHGEIFFGNSRGFTLFDPANLKSNTTLPQLVFTDFQIFNQSVLPGAADSPLRQSINATDALTLSHKQSVFSLEFAALSYQLSETNQYAYRLVGFDQQWQRVGTKRTATYTNLDPGLYTFEVKAANSEGLWNDEPRRLQIRVLPPWWKTWWAYAIYACLVLLLLYWFSHVQRLKLFYEQKKLEQERLLVKRLTELDRLKDEFLANTSHELRTPLNGIIGLAESLIDGATGELDQKTRYNLAMIVTSGKRLASLVDDLLDFAKLKNKGLTLRRKSLDLQVLVDVVVGISQPLVAKKPVQLINRVSADLPPVFADEDRLIQIFHNLIGNAAKFTDRGSIQISAEVEGNQLWVHVVDTGIGIPADKLDTIFESFQQIEGSIERITGGAGLGLSITRKLVELHGGEIRVESVFGQGSHFSFSLPVSRGLPAATSDTDTETNLLPASERPVLSYSQLLHEEELTDEAPLAENAQQPHILVVDDDPINRQVLVNYLALRNYRVTEAASGEEAIQLIRRQGAVDLVLLDIMMPRLSGYQTCKCLRERYPAHELPIIFLTARSQMSDLVAGFDAGGNDFLTKPVAKEELLARVATHLQLHDMMRNLDHKVAERTEELKRKNEGLRQAQMALEKAYQKLEEASLADPLTGLHNRRFLNRFINADVSLVEREYHNWLKSHLDSVQLSGQGASLPENTDLIFMLLDVDHFKIVNDQHGHSAGDRVLEQLSRLLEAELRDSDYLVRWGGEEFLIVVRFANRGEAQEMADRIREAVAAHAFDIGEGQLLHKTCSLGFASYPFYPGAPTALSWEQVIDTADRALYAAKKSGRNRAVGLAAGTAIRSPINPAVREDIAPLIDSDELKATATRREQPLSW